MSYEICNSISLNKAKNQLKVNIASNNVWPKDWHNVEPWKEKNFRDKMKTLLDCLLSGDVVISSVNDKTIDVFYAYNVIVNANKIIDKWTDRDLYNKQLDELVDNFVDLINEKHSGVYAFQRGCGFINKLGNYDYKYGGYKYLGWCNDLSFAKKFDYKRAYILENGIAKRCGFEKIALPY